MSVISDLLDKGLTALTEKGAVSLALSGTAHSFNALVEPIESTDQGKEDWTPSDDEEAFVYLAKSEEATKTRPTRGQSFYDATAGIYYEIREPRSKGPMLTSRYRCRLTREVN